LVRKDRRIIKLSDANRETADQSTCPFLFYRSADGLVVYGCSSDGTIIAIQFDASELPDLGTAEDTTKLLEANEWKPTKVNRSGAMHQQQVSARQTSSQASSLLSLATPSKGGVNYLQPRKGAQKMTRLPDGKRRIQPDSALGSANPIVSRPLPQQPIASTSNPGGAIDVFAAAADQPLESQSNVIQSRDDLIQNAPSAFEDENTQRGEKRKYSIGEYDPPSRQVKTRTLGGGERPKETWPVRELRPAMQGIKNMSSISASRLKLPLPMIQNRIRVRSEDDEHLVAEAENSDNGKSMVTPSFLY
jgi:protein HIRA/HIR1